MVTAGRLREVLSYDPETGVFVWRERLSTRTRVGDVAGCPCKTNGYVLIRIDGRGYYAHRLAWLYMHGSFPPDEIDHRDGDRANNKLDNLRACSHAQNQKNRPRQRNKSGFKGVRLERRTGKWFAAIASNGKQTHLGTYHTPEAAHAAYCAAAANLHGDFARFE
jgi:hypothetical protein